MISKAFGRGALCIVSSISILSRYSTLSQERLLKVGVEVECWCFVILTILITLPGYCFMPRGLWAPRFRIPRFQQLFQYDKTTLRTQIWTQYTPWVLFDSVGAKSFRRQVYFILTFPLSSIRRPKIINTHGLTAIVGCYRANGVQEKPSSYEYG